LGNPLKTLSERIKLYLRVTRARGIARRYFVLNGFDGAMTMFGIVVMSWIAGWQKPEPIVVAGLGACFAMGVSGFFGAYMAERAERDRRLKEIEKETNGHVDPLRYEASRFVTFYVALVDAVSPSLTGMISLIPFFLSIGNKLSIENAYLTSLALTLASLFSLGFYLGRIAKENSWFYGLKMLSVGVGAAVFIFLIETLL